MIFRSKKYPWVDIVITLVMYYRKPENTYCFNAYSIIAWERANPVEFDKYVCKMKGYNYIPDKNGEMDFSDKTTFPYPYFGDMKQKSMDNYIRKYELEFVEMDDREVTVHADDDFEYYSSFKED